MAKKVFMEGSIEEFDDQEEIEIEKGKLFNFICSYTEGYSIDFELPQLQKGEVIIASGYRLSSSQFSYS